MIQKFEAHFEKHFDIYFPTIQYVLAVLATIIFNANFTNILLGVILFNQWRVRKWKQENN